MFSQKLRDALFKKNTRILMTPKFHRRVDNSQLRNLILSQFNALNILIQYLINIKFNSTIS